jgi:hypothetical protein
MREAGLVEARPEEDPEMNGRLEIVDASRGSTSTSKAGFSPRKRFRNRPRP